LVRAPLSTEAVTRTTVEVRLRPCYYPPPRMKAHRGSLWWHCCGLATVSALGFAACGGNGRSNTVASTPIAPTTSTPTSKWSTAGQVVATGTEQNVGGATLTPGWSLAPVTADAAGNYELGDR